MDLKKFDSRPVALPIQKIIKENENTNTYVFRYPLGSRPGQFVMMWIPGVDEKPFSVAYDDGKEFWLTICNVGGATAELFKLKAGDKVGIRGPMGTSYEFKKGERIATVAGGYGAAPMYFVARTAVGCKVDFIVGARNKKLLLFIDRVKKLENVKVHVATDDGSAGVKGYNTVVLDEILNKKKIDRVFACGPEVMEYAVGKVVDKHSKKKKINCAVSVEKYMKCGIGVCGQCAIDDTGELACIKGPVMDWNYLKKLPEFGQYHRDAQGKKHFFRK